MEHYNQPELPFEQTPSDMANHILDSANVLTQTGSPEHVAYILQETMTLDVSREVRMEIIAYAAEQDPAIDVRHVRRELLLNGMKAQKTLGEVLKRLPGTRFPDSEKVARTTLIRRQNVRRMLEQSILTHRHGRNIQPSPALEPVEKPVHD